MPPRHLPAGAYAPNATWCVVRDPVDRALSVYKETHVGAALNDSASAGAWLRRTLAGFSGAFPVGRQCHLVPQVEYVFDAGGGRACGRVLRFETLARDVDALMASVGLAWRWARDFGDRKTHHAPSNLTAASLAPADASLVRRVYRDDGCRLGYACVR